ncbi:MAG: thiamine phosphate synthase [Nocardioidaceae bacterium]
MSAPRLLVATDRRQVAAGRTIEDVVRACADVGVRWFWVREHDLPVADRAALVRRLVRVPGTTVVAGRTALPGAVGVHLAADAPVPAAVRWLGRSCHDVRQVRAAVTAGADYLTISPVAVSASKPGYGPSLGPAGVERAVRVADGVPVLALGGVDDRNAARFVAAGAHGVAVMGCVMRSADPAGAAERLLAAVGP